MHDILSEPFIAHGAMTRYQAVTLQAAGRCEAVDSVADIVLGFVQETVAVADAGRRVVGVMTHGVTIAIAAAPITAGANLKVTATGRLTPTTAVNDIIVARARTAAAADGDWLEVDIIHSVRTV